MRGHIPRGHFRGHISGVIFPGVTFQGLIFKGIILKGVIFRGAKIQEVKLKGSFFVFQGRLKVTLGSFERRKGVII